MILRVWRSRIRTADRQAYREYMEATGLRDYRETRGNRGCQMVMRQIGERITEVMTLSWWDDLESIKSFAGDDFLAARYYPRDREFLLAKPPYVEQFDVVDVADAADD